VRNLVSGAVVGFILLAPVLADRQAAFAKPMMEPKLEEAVKSRFVVIAQYSGYKAFREPVTYFDGVMGRYLLEKVMKGPQIRDPHINVAYAFHDGSACLAEPDWKFSDKIMPKVGSSWILFLEEPNWKSSNTDNAFSTYRGDFGRMPATAANIEKVKKMISPQN
jgi:hypothetical protein